jgi:hypothetical protein
MKSLRRSIRPGARGIKNLLCVPDFRIHRSYVGESFMSGSLVLKHGGHEGEAIGVKI